MRSSLIGRSLIACRLRRFLPLPRWALEYCAQAIAANITIVAQAILISIFICPFPLLIDAHLMATPASSCAGQTPY